MNEDVKSLALTCGFLECRILRPDKFMYYERRLLHGALHTGGRSLSYDLPCDYPWANAILTLIWPYTPYSASLPLCSYYAPSNAAYHASGDLLERLSENGLRAERVYVPLRELLLRSGTGVALKNGLTAIIPYGTRFAVQTLIACMERPAYDDRPPLGACEDCGACAAACPAGAITNNGFDFRYCLRAYMGKETMPVYVMERMNQMLGCERCQYACPYNEGIGATDALPDAFTYERLLKNDISGALAIVGRNQKSGGRLVAHAAVMAANEGRADLLPRIEALADDPREPVRAAAEYAISKLHIRKTMI